MSSEVGTIEVVFEDDQTGQEIFLYSGQTTTVPILEPLCSWTLLGTPIKFSASTACTVTSPHCLEVRETLQTITAMKIYSSRSIEELRLEDYSVKRPQRSSIVKFPRSVNGVGLRVTSSSSFLDSNEVSTFGTNAAIIRVSFPQRKAESPVAMSTDCSADESEAQATSTSYSFRTNFRPNTDPARVFTPPQPQAADKKPLSALSVSEAQELKNSLLESIAKCMQIQNSLYKLVLLKLQAFIRGQADADADHRGESNGDTGDSQSTGPRALLNELNEPLNSLMRCADIQRSLYQRLVTVSLISCEETEQPITVVLLLHRNLHGQVYSALLGCRWKHMCNLVPGVISYPQLHDYGEERKSYLQEVFQVLKNVDSDEQADLEDNSMAVQYELEEIAFENRLECSYARNPFTSIEYRASTNKDFLHRVSGKRAQLPHGRGSLETVKGKLVYTGQWRKGKRHGKGEGLIFSFNSTQSTPNYFAAEHGFYTGGWKHNMRHGHGQMTFSSDAVYEGQWLFDKMTGYGTLKLPDGTIQEGTWKEGSLQGCALFTWPHGVTEYREYDTIRGQLSSCKIEKEAAEKLSQMSSLRSQLLKLREQVSKLKEEKSSLLELLNTQKTDQAEAKREIMSSLAKLKENFTTQRKKDYQQQRDEYEQKLKKATESESKSAERIRELEKQLEESSNAQLCQICFEHPRDCIIMPCTHLLYCRACVAEHKRSGANRCPTCRGPISGEILCNVNHSS